MTKNQNSKQNPYREDRLKPVLRTGGADKYRIDWFDKLTILNKVEGQIRIFQT